METWIDTETLYEGKLITVKKGTVRLDDGQTAMREVVEHPGGVAVVPYIDDSVVLVRQYRVALGKDILEVPAGKLEGEEDPEHRGRVELEEEAGYKAGCMIDTGFFYPSCGFLTERLYVFLALDLEKTEQRLEWDENIEVVHMPFGDVKQGLANHAFDDAKTIIGLHALIAHLGNSEGHR